LATRLSCMICRTERPGKFCVLCLQHTDWLPFSNYCFKRWTCDQPLGIVLLRWLNDLFSLGLIANRRLTIARCRECVIKTFSDDACSPVNMNIFGTVLVAGRSIIKSGYLPITISRSWWTIIQLARVILHESATHGHKRGARFPGLLLRHFTDSLRKQTKWRELFGTVDHLSVVLHGRPLKGLDSLCIQTANGAIAERRHRGCLPRLGMYHSDYRQRP
jgi:hypothetical protein